MCSAVRGGNFGIPGCLTFGIPNLSWSLGVRKFEGAPHSFAAARCAAPPAPPGVTPPPPLAPPPPRSPRTPARGPPCREASSRPRSAWCRGATSFGTPFGLADNRRCRGLYPLGLFFRQTTCPALIEDLVASLPSLATLRVPSSLTSPTHPLIHRILFRAHAIRLCGRNVPRSPPRLRPPLTPTAASCKQVRLATASPLVAIPSS